MKTNYWLIMGAMLAASAIAQDNTNQLPEMPAPVTSPTAETTPAPAATETMAPAETNAPVATAPKKKKHVATRKKINEPTMNLVAGPAEVTVSNLIVRGQAGLNGEMIAHVFKGDTVTVMEQINLQKHTAGEPAQWAKIAYPTNANVWVSARYIDANNTVTTKKLNERAGPGENYSVVGTLDRGTAVTQVETKGKWIKIEPSADAYAFVAAMYLNQEVLQPVATAPQPTAEEPMPTPVTETQPPLPEPTAPEAPAENTPPPTRNATHEGVVRHVGSLITPTAYELYDPTTDKNIDFLYTTTTNLDFAQYVGMRIIVNGDEGLAERWPDTPVMTVQSITVVDPNAVPQRVYYSPRQSQGH